MKPLYKAACDEIDAAAADLNELSLEIWNHPEENFQETHAHKVLTDFLEPRGLSVEKNYIVETGFRSVFGTAEDGPHVAVLCEYDALPEIGHGCGHNLIAEAGIAAGIGVHAAFKANEKPLGKLTIMGTPAEEGGGGKIDMINAKCFDDVDVAMMAHPAPFDIEALEFLAIDQVEVKFHGKAAHASAFPWDGVNALDAAVLCYQNVSCMRQQLKPTWRVHGIIKNGGVKPNIIPELTELEYYARTPSKKELEELIKKLDSCFQSAAAATGCTCSPGGSAERIHSCTLLAPCLSVRREIYTDRTTSCCSAATGCSVEICWRGRPFLDVITNKITSNLYHKNAKLVGVDFDAHGPPDKANIPAGSTDMGNVSYVVPSIHPMFYIGTNAVNHTRGFTEASGDPKAQPFTIAVGKALAMTAIDIFTQPETLKTIKEEFAQRPK